MIRPGAQTDTPRVVLVGDFSAHFDAIHAGITAARVEVLRFPTDRAFRDGIGGAWAEADVLCAVGSVRVDGSLLDAAPRLRAVVTPYAGVEGFDRAAAAERGILVVNGHIPENSNSMAEATILLILACLYDLPGKQQHLRKNARGIPPFGTMLQGKTVGFIGFGRVARAIADRLATWGAPLQAYSPRLQDPPANVSATDLDTLLQTSDVICILAALTAGTRSLLCKDRLRLIKRGAVLINVARGAIIDEPALIEEARAGRFSRIALDVFETEPLPADSPLRALPNLILTPHAIGHTAETARRIPAAAIENVTMLLRGEVPPYVCNPAALPSWRERFADPASLLGSET